MNIFIAGGGRVGFYLARLLSVEGHDVTVIEAAAGTVERIDAALDVSTIVGNAASVMLQKNGGVAKADLFVAVTGNNEVNLVAAATAKSLGANQVVARVENPIYVDGSILYETILGIDYFLSPDGLTAQDIAKYIEQPGLIAGEDFGRGRVLMRQVRVTKSPTVNGKTLADVIPPGSDTGVLLGVINRNGTIMTARGDATVEPGDLITLVGQREKMADAQKLFQGVEPRLDKVVIMGGGSVGLHLAQNLENRQRNVKLFEHKLTRCQELAATLNKTKVVYRDGTSRVALEEEHVDSADVFVATSSDDERNIMSAVLAKEVGAKRTITVVHQPDFAPLVTKLGIDHAVTPRACIANRILRLVHQKSVSSLAVLEEGQIEILEFNVKGDAPIIGNRLIDLRAKFPKEAVVATIIRGDQVIVPTGQDEIHAGDSAVVIATRDSLEAVRKFFLR